ncbi:MAG: hypothetical protein U0935_25615, partial [Pirellulales bacterium]
MCEELARSELKDRATQHPEAVTFEFPNLGRKQATALYLKRGQDREEKVNPAALTLLTCLLVGEIRSMDVLRSKVVAARDRAERKDFGDDAGYVRKLKERLSKTLAKLFGCPLTKIFHGGKTEVPKLSQDLRIYGAVQKISRFR